MTRLGIFYQGRVDFARHIILSRARGAESPVKPVATAPTRHWPDKTLAKIHSFLNNYPVFNPKPQLESLEPQLFTHNFRCNLANVPGTLIRQNTVFNLTHLS